MAEWGVTQKDCLHVMIALQHNSLSVATDVPWGRDVFDVIVLITDPEASKQVRFEFIADMVAQTNVDWVDTVGYSAELLHDMIDGASVAIGREAWVGGGSPMTAWHDHITDWSEMLAFVRLGGQGGSDNKLIVVLGNNEAYEYFRKHINDDTGLAGIPT